MKKPKVDAKEVIKYLLMHKTEVAKQFNHSSASVWSIISTLMSNKMSSKAVDTFVKENRSNCLEALEIQQKVHCTHHRAQRHSSESSDETEKFDFFIDMAKWIEMPNGISRKLKKGWTDVLNDILFTKERLNECIWAFKYGYIKSNSNEIISSYMMPILAQTFAAVVIYACVRVAA